MRRSFFAFSLFLTLASVTGAHAAEIRYVPATLPNISNALFAKGVLKTDDSAAVDEYIRIHQCGLYEQYGNDDFAWAHLREAQALDLDTRKGEFPEGLEINSSVVLDKYNLNTNEFDIVEHARMNNMGSVSVMSNQTGSISNCEGQSNSGFVPRMHPLNLTVKLDHAVTMVGVPMSRSTADELVGIMSKRRDSINDPARTVLLQMRVRITGNDPLSVVRGSSRTVLGQLDEIRVYEGPERKMLLFKKSFESQPASAGKN